MAAMAATECLEVRVVVQVVVVSSMRCGGECAGCAAANGRMCVWVDRIDHTLSTPPRGTTRARAPRTRHIWVVAATRLVVAAPMAGIGRTAGSQMK